MLTLLCFAGCVTEISIPANGNPENNTRPQTSWQEIHPGMNYGVMHLKTSNSPDFKDLIIVITDPKQYFFSIVQNTDAKSAKTIREIHEETGSLLTFNGGFFTEDFKPTGLLISGGKKLREPSSANLINGILAIDNEGRAELFSNKSAINAEKYGFAIQNGPVLLDKESNIKITEDSGKTASRTAIGLDKEDNIVLIVLKQSLLNVDNQITLYEFAHLLKENPEFAIFGLHSMLNLDGGPSTGMMVMDRYFPEMEKVQNVVIVKKRIS